MCVSIVIFNLLIIVCFLFYLYFPVMYFPSILNLIKCKHLICTMPVETNLLFDCLLLQPVSEGGGASGTPPSFRPCGSAEEKGTVKTMILLGSKISKLSILVAL